MKPFTSAKIVSRTVFGALLFGSVAGLVAAPTADEIIALARSYLGTEADLNAVKSVRYTGTTRFDDGSLGEIELIVRKPMCQRTMITVDKGREITGLDGYQAWRIAIPTENPTAWEMTLLNAPQIRGLRANTWEDVGFYKGIESIGGRVEVQGETDVDGVKCVKVAFIHDRNIQFTRYFDAAKGRLVMSETSDGDSIRENGEIVMNGVRFPREITTTSKQGKRVITFTSVLVNEEFPNSLFEVPIIMPGTRPKL